MNIKILGLGLAIVSCLSLSLVSCANKQPKISTTQTLQIGPDRISSKLDLVPGSVSALSGAAPKSSVTMQGFQDRKNKNGLDYLKRVKMR